MDALEGKLLIRSIPGLFLLGPVLRTTNHTQRAEYIQESGCDCHRMRLFAGADFLNANDPGFLLGSSVLSHHSRNRLYIVQFPDYGHSSCKFLNPKHP